MIICKNKKTCCYKIVSYIADKSLYCVYITFSEELKIKRNLSNFHDSRVHACLYFITPNGHGLKSIDLVCMKKLDAKVNIIPIIAKADTINKTELANFKVTMIGANNIHYIIIAYLECFWHNYTLFYF